VKGILLVMTKPAEGRDDEYNDWYNEIHLPEVLDVPGFTAARRFVGEPTASGAVPPAPYLAVYEIEADDLGEAQAALTKAAATMNISSALDRSSAIMYSYRLLYDTQGQ
jgi:hypothetical protein